MSDWLSLLVYLAGWVWTARKIAVALDNDETFDSPDSFERAGNRALGFIAGCLWPIILVGALMTGRLPKSTRQLRREAEDRERRIRQLERELGIGATR